MTDTIDKILDTVICGDCLEVLPSIPTGSVHCVVTSPPYWGLRDYGVDGQLGMEKTPEDYIAKMVQVFREVWRVLRDDGTLWLNMGDSYVGSGKGGGGCFEKLHESRRRDTAIMPRQNKGVPGLKPKDLCGIPWRVALALQADGWYLRQDIIWSKPNPMPESVTDRCTKAHEYIFLLTKKPRYYYDAEAIKEEAVESNASRPRMGQGPNTQYNQKRRAQDISGSYAEQGSIKHEITNKGTRTKRFGPDPEMRNKRSVWTVPTCPYPEAHFATFPPKLIEPCILAGCPQWVCEKCGEPRRRITDPNTGGTTGKSWHDHSDDMGKGNAKQQTGEEYKTYRAGETTGWTDCGCNAGFDGGIVLDPFMGSGTVAAVAYENNRHYIGIELNPDKTIRKRLTDVHKKYALFDTAKGGDG